MFMLEHGEHIVDRIGDEVDRLEQNIKRSNPEIRHIDLEPS
jgi:zinc transporter 9